MQLYIPRENVNSWRFVHDTGLLDLSVENTSANVQLRHRRWHKGKFMEGSDYLFGERFEKASEAREHWQDIIRMGVLNYLGFKGISLELPVHLLKRMDHPSHKSYRRAVNGQQYVVEWSYIWQSYANCPCGCPVGHPSGCNISVRKYDKNLMSYSQEKIVPYTSWTCADFDQGVAELERLLNDPKAMVMESLL